MKKSCLVIICFLTFFTFQSKAQHTDLIYLDLTIDYNEMIEDIMSIIETKIDERTVVMIPNGIEPYIQKLVSIQDFILLEDILYQNWNNPVHYLNLNKLYDFFEKNNSFDILNSSSIKITVFSDKKNIDKLFFDDFLINLLISNKILSSNKIDEKISIDFFVINLPNQKLLPPFLSTNNFTQL